MSPSPPSHGPSPMSPGHPPLFPSQHLAGAPSEPAERVGVSCEAEEAQGAAPADRPLRERLEPVATDRASTSSQIVRETSGLVLEWFLEDPGERGRDGRLVERELELWVEEQAWRGPCAAWLDSLRLAWAEAEGKSPGSRSERIAREMIAWQTEDSGSPHGGTRLASRPRLA